MIVWGTKRKLKRLGNIAEFCPLCRSIQPFAVTRISMAGHIYFISLGSGQTVGFTATCRNCGLQIPVDATEYGKIAKRPLPDIEALVQQTYPTIADVYAERLAIENRLTSKQALSADERLALIREPFDAIVPMLEQRCGGETQFDKPTGIGCAATLLLPAMLVIIPLVLDKQRAVDTFFGPAALVVGGASFLVTLFFLVTTNYRYFKSTLYPVLARCLLPLDPTKDELDSILETFRTAGLQVGTRLKAQRILDTIEELRLRPQSGHGQ